VTSARAVLALVAEQPRHGTRSSRRSASAPAASAAEPRSIYPTVSQLEDEGLVRTEKVDGRLVVHLTEAGTSYVEEHRAELDAVWAAVDHDVDSDAPRCSSS